MNHSDAKYSFTEKEFKRIRELVALLERTPKDKQTNVRNKLRDMKLYWNDFARKVPYTVESLERFLKNGILKIMEDNKEKEFSEKETDSDTSALKVFEKGKQKSDKSRRESDEAYVIGLCDEVLGRKAEIQKRFDFLKGDEGHTLPVDAFYEDLNLVIEYYERQHTEKVTFFDKKQTVSGVSRGEQRKIYDERRKEVLPKHDIKLIIFSYTDFGDSYKLKRNKPTDIEIVRSVLKDYLT